MSADRRRMYTAAHVKKLELKIRVLDGEIERSRASWQDERDEVRRYERLLGERWDEMQRLRDLLYAIATHTAPRSVVEREIQRLGEDSRTSTAKEVARR